jgi:hypothetical protein
MCRTSEELRLNYIDKTKMLLSEVEPLSRQLRDNFKELEIYTFITEYVLKQ